jgi:hypothetical protein
VWPGQVRPWQPRAPGAPKCLGVAPRLGLSENAVAVNAEERLIVVLREIDERLTAGRASKEIAAREQRRGSEVLMLETELDVGPGARTLVLVLLNRQRVSMWPKPRSRRGKVMIAAPAVFLQEVLLKELDVLGRAFVEYLESAAEETAFKAFGVKVGRTVQQREG